MVGSLALPLLAAYCTLTLLAAATLHTSVTLSESGGLAHTFTAHWLTSWSASCTAASPIAPCMPRPGMACAR